MVGTNVVSILHVIELPWNPIIYIPREKVLNLMYF